MFPDPEHGYGAGPGWWAVLLPVVLAACATPAADREAVTGPYSATPRFTVEAATPGDQQGLIELELEPAEIVQLREFMALMPPDHRRPFLSVVSQMDEGFRGLLIASYIIPEPEDGFRFAELVSHLGEEYEAGLGRQLGKEFYGRWFGLQEALRSGIERSVLIDTVRLFSLGGICLYDEEDFANYRASQVMIAQPVMLCDSSIEALDEAWNYPPPAMINALPAPEGTAPWQVQLMRAGRDREYYHRPIRARYEMERYGRRLEGWERDHVCGAVYIGRKYALTAAHCVEGWDGYDADFFDGRRIRAGSIDIDEGGEIIAITAVVIHSAYQDAKAYAGHDIALLVLASEPRREDTSRARIPLHPRNGQKPGTILVQTGWGLTGATINSRLARDLEGNLQQASRFLRIGELKLYDDSKCNKDSAFRQRKVTIGYGQLCAGSEEGVDACKGDSGGPLVRVVNGALPILVGLVSWGIGCGYEGRPAIYTDVGAFHGWIKRAKNGARPGRMIRLR